MALGLDSGSSKSKSESSGTSTTTPNVPGFLSDPYQAYASGVQSFAGTPAGSQDWNAYLAQNPDVASKAATEGAAAGMTPTQYAQYQYNNYGQTEGRQVPTSAGTGLTPTNMGASSLQTTAFNSAPGLATPNAAIGQGTDATRSLINYQPGLLGDTDLSKYLNPYTDDVINSSVNDLDSARKRAINGNSSNATLVGGSGAWQNDRAGVADSETNRGFLDQVSSLVSNLRNTGYTNAQTAASGDLDRSAAGAQFRLGAANQLSSQGVSADANARANLGTLSDLGATQRTINQENDPYAILLKKLADYGGLLGQIPIDAFSGSTTAGSQTTTGSGSKIGASASWSPSAGFNA